MLVLAFFAFLSGMITILSPCILPVLPVVLAGGAGRGRRKPLGIITGFILSFTLVTVSLSALTRAFGIGPGVLRIVAVAAVSLFGLVMLIPGLSLLFEKLASGITGAFQPSVREGGRSRNEGFLSGIGIGLSLGILWTPCVGPIIASVITVALAGTADAGAVVITFFYSLGTAIPMFAVMKGGRSLIGRFSFLTRNMERIRRGFGVLMLFTALSMSLGWDLRFQAFVLKALPSYGRGLTLIEDTGAVQNALTERQSSLWGVSSGYAEEGVFTGVGNDVSMQGVPGFYGMAPTFSATGPWLNSSPLKMSELTGKVVLIDFWTYSCINCIRTLPYLKSWNEKYADQGFVIIGVHSPEFVFEQEPGNVRKAVKDLSVSWPVVLDNDFSQWRAYNNRFWPAHFLIDSRGNVRYFTFGEGRYGETERMIRSLLVETGARFASFSEHAGYGEVAATPETYLGKERADRMQLDPPLGLGTEVYSLRENPDLHHWSIGGEWKITYEYAEPVKTEGGDISLHFDARSVFAVIDPLEDAGVSPQLRVEFGGKTEEIDLSEPRMYRLLGFDQPKRGTVRMHVPKGVRIYSFTFGG